MNDTTSTPASGRRKGRRYSKEERAELIRQYEGCGQGMREFCGAHGLSTGSLSRWLGRRRKPRFAALTVALSGSAPFELTYPNGVRLTVRPAANREECVTLLRELAGC